MMDDATIVYQISTGDISEGEKMKLLRRHIESIRKGERIRIANKLMDDKAFGGNNE